MVISNWNTVDPIELFTAPIERTVRNDMKVVYSNFLSYFFHFQNRFKLKFVVAMFCVFGWIVIVKERILHLK